MYGCMAVRVKMLLRGYLSTIAVTICIDVPLPLVPIPSPSLINICSFNVVQLSSGLYVGVVLKFHISFVVVQFFFSHPLFRSHPILPHSLVPNILFGRSGGVFKVYSFFSFLFSLPRFHLSFVSVRSSAGFVFISFFIIVYITKWIYSQGQKYIHSCL